ncbi:hypothetical protein HPB49_021880 [Dermacentor silvarum]|uniref:Uncharacterized protein n=1 Tax=Dermacentor silvarum TaxID=543639 RepID=A0ACB8E3E1_DERSI|nr:hypothetical protein HPB49_021880 [Dermacentor silvarum]
MDATPSAPELAAVAWTPPDAAAMNEIAPPPKYRLKLSCDLCSRRRSPPWALSSCSPPSRSRRPSPRTPCTSSSSRAFPCLCAPSPPPSTGPVDHTSLGRQRRAPAPARITVQKVRKGAGRSTESTTESSGPVTRTSGPSEHRRDHGCSTIGTGAGGGGLDSPGRGSHERDRAAAKVPAQAKLRFVLTPTLATLGAFLEFAAISVTPAIPVNAMYIIFKSLAFSCPPSPPPSTGPVDHTSLGRRRHAPAQAPRRILPLQLPPAWCVTAWRAKCGHAEGELMA